MRPAIRRGMTRDESVAWRGLNRMQAHLAAVLNRQLSADSGLSLSDYHLLVALGEHPDGRMRAYRLGRDLGWEKSRLSHHVARMERRGLVVRERCPTDHRGLFVVLTDSGRAALETAAPRHAAAVRRWFLDHLDAEQLRTLADITDAVEAGLAGECATADAKSPAAAGDAPPTAGGTPAAAGR